MDYDPKRIERCFDTSYRMRRLNELRVECGLTPKDIDSDDTMKKPSVGIEIEMTWRQAFQDMQDWKGATTRPKDLDPESPRYKDFAERYDANDRQLRPLLEHVEQVIPRVGRDAYWEFSFLPVYDPTLLSLEVETLFELGILHKHEEYATHLTVAGVDNDRDAFAIMVACEMAGGTTPERLQAPLRTQAGAWSRRHDVVGGLRRRAHHELYGEATCGYELRTLVTKSPHQITEVVRLAQELAYMMQCDPESWLHVRGEIEARLTDSHLPLSSWDNPKNQPDIWQKYSQLVHSKTNS